MTSNHRWHFFRAGGVDQVSLRNADDLLALPDLDQKLWVALAMPTHGVDLDPTTLALIDLDNDGRIRVHDIKVAIAWIKATFKNPNDVLRSASEIKLSALADDKIVAAARRMLTDLGKKDATAITVEDTDAVTKAFTETVLNGDGVIIPESTSDAELRKVIETIIEAVGGTPDRSGKTGIDRARADELFAAVDARRTWLKRGTDASLLPLGDKTAAASDALAAVRAKLDDFFTRTQVAAFDPRAAAALAAQEAELTALSARSLSTNDESLAKLPLAKIDASGQLSLERGLNPAWAARIATFADAAVHPILGARPTLAAADLRAITDRLAAYTAWTADKPTTKADNLEPAWLERLADPTLREKLIELIGQDTALAGEYDQITSVSKAVRLQRDFGRLLRNFVNFSEFYGGARDGVFQAGTLYLDARALHLCVEVGDVPKHASLATSADSFLIYCEIKRKDVTKHICVAVTNGDPDNLFVGRNGIFYDRKGNDWDATIIKIVSNPISIREAFWSPYKKVVKTIEDNVTRRVSAADAAATAKLDAVGKTVANVDTLAAQAPAAAPPPVKKIDLGTVAAIGVAIGGIGTLFGAILAAMFGLGPWLPLGLLAILLLISGPAMALAYLKLRRRNLGPILDANGWAINGRARINVSFGAAMTELAKLPPGSGRSLDDPFADKRTPWKRWVALALIVILAGAWYVGKLDRWLPDAVSSTRVLGANAPAAKRAAEEAAKAAPAAAPAGAAAAPAAEDPTPPPK